MKKLILLLLLVYKKYFSLALGAGCKFNPTCSEYTYQQIQKHGTMRGLYLGVKRLLTCYG